MATKPIKFLELHYRMTQFLMISEIPRFSSTWRLYSRYLSACLIDRHIKYYTTSLKINDSELSKVL